MADLGKQTKVTYYPEPAKVIPPEPTKVTPVEEPIPVRVR